LYLAAYEWLFRGVLLPACLDGGLSVSSAIIINTALYSLVHVPKGRTEVWAAIPFGVAVCWLTIETQSIWSALLLHVALALTNEWSSWYFHPDMQKSSS
jgi:membrane protease YdiL (CAAX protease family)